MTNRWDTAAEVRKKQIESCIDLTFCKVFLPFYIDYVQSNTGKYILEIGAGTGHLSKELSLLGRDITAIEPSQGMYSIAKEVVLETNVRLLNCSLQEFKADINYDLTISHMVVHTVNELNSFLFSIKKILKKDGRFIFSMPHPCFYNEYKQFFNKDEYQYMSEIKKEINFTITKDIENEIKGVPYIHRPLSFYINTLISNGFIIDFFYEIYPSKEVQMMYGSEWESPRYCVFSCTI